MVPLVFIGITTVIFGIVTLIMSSRARKRLAPGSLRDYVGYFSICLAFMVFFSLWQTIRMSLTDYFKISFSGLTEYPEYLFIILAYIAFIFASYKITKISREFGFVEEGKAIHSIVKEKNQKKK